MSDEKVYKEFWILKTPGGDYIEYDEPMSYDWSRCRKIHVVEASALESANAEIAAWKLKNDTLNWPKVEAEVSSLKSELEAAKAENLKLEEKLRMAFNCCGGNDDEFKEHTMDCIDWVSRAELQVSHATLSAQLDKAALKEAVDARDYWQQRASRTKIEQFVFENATLTDQLVEKADQVTAAKEALEYINHECMNSDICPTREQMQIKARETLARINNDK